MRQRRQGQIVIGAQCHRFDVSTSYTAKQKDSYTHTVSLKSPLSHQSREVSLSYCFFQKKKT